MFCCVTLLAKGVRMEHNKTKNSFESILDYFTYGGIYGAEIIIINEIKNFVSSLDKHKSVVYMYSVEDAKKHINNEALIYMIISTLERMDIINWGTSIRNGWFENGKIDELKNDFLYYFINFSALELEELHNSRT